MKIVEVGHHCCIRLCKQAIALTRGHEVHLIGFQKPHAGLDMFKTFNLCLHVSHLEKALELHKDADIIHIHNEPNWMVVTARQVLKNKAIVMDVHDSMLFRSDSPEDMVTTERLAFEMADGLVFPSEKCADIVLNAYESLKNKPHCVMPPYVNKMYYKMNDWLWKGGVIYEGLVETDKGPQVMQYANLKETAIKFKEGGVPFHVMSPWKGQEQLDFYKDAFCEAAFPYDKMIKHLGHFDWGFCGNVNHFKDWDVAMPNKLFEYLAGGIPVIAMNCESVGKFVEENGFGISVKTVDEIKARWEERSKCQANVMMKRFDFAMENKIHIVEGLYNTILSLKMKPS